MTYQRKCLSMILSENTKRIVNNIKYATGDRNFEFLDQVNCGKY